MKEKIQHYLNEGLQQAIDIRHELHQCPELGFEEDQTAKKVAERLQQLGYKIETGIGRTGIIAILDSGKPGKCVGLRADLDALPLQEETGVDFKSHIAGKMHACGHDGHIATLLLTADILRKITDQFTGKIKFIFQPAEEVGQGAKAMIAAGVLTNPTVDAIFGYHNLPGFPKGQILVRSGCIMAGRMVVKIHIKGVGGHSSTPEKTIDPIYVGSCIVQHFHSMKNRLFPSNERLVISITQFHAGSAENIIPAEAELIGTIRFTNNTFVKELQEQIKLSTVAVGNAYDAHVVVTFPELAPATINSEQEAQLVYQTALDLFGEQQVVNLDTNIMASEDFAFFLNHIPGCFFLIGIGSDQAYLHNSHYQFEDEILPTAAELLATTAINYLNKPQKD